MGSEKQLGGREGGRGPPRRIGLEDARAERRVLEICDIMLRRLTEGPIREQGLKGRITRRRQP